MPGVLQVVPFCFDLHSAVAGGGHTTARHWKIPLFSVDLDKVWSLAQTHRSLRGAGGRESSLAAGHMTKRPFREESDQIMDSFGMAKALILLSRGAGVAGVDEAELQVDMQQHHPAGRVFECKTCNRQFPSFQALGGHRASHKKPRLAAGDQHGQAQAALQAKPRVHECSICGLEFAIGQALGGHMRRHRSASTEGFPLVPLLGTKKTAAAGADGDKRPPGVLCLDLDLNQLPPADHEVDVRCALSFSLGPPPMVCLH